MIVFYLFLLTIILGLIYLGIWKYKKTTTLETTLFKQETKELYVKITASINNNGLHIVGHDMGEQLIFLKGRDEFEYELKVHSMGLQQLYTMAKITINDKESLLNYIKEHYSGNLGLSNLRRWLHHNKIPFNYYAY